MLKKKISIIGQFAPPMHGLSKALDTIYRSNALDCFEFDKINLTNNKNIFKNLIKIANNDADLFYFTISQSKMGNLRDLIILKLLNLQKKKCIIHLHGGYYRELIDNELGYLQKKWNYSAIKNVEGVIVLSDSLKYIFKDMIDESKIHTVKNCIDDDMFMSEELFNQKLNCIDKKELLNVLYLSNFIKSKGYEEVLKLAKIEKENCIKFNKEKELHFNFAGKFFNENDKQEFFKYIYDNELEDYITYHGIVSGLKKQELLKNNDIFVLLTKYPKEGQPISILEAMGNGMVVITTNHAGIPDIVNLDVNGYITDNINKYEIYSWILKNKKKFSSIINNNRLIIKKQYMQDTYINALKDIFKST